MQEPINQTQGETPSPSHNGALLAGAAVLGGAALLSATPARAQSKVFTFNDIPGTGDAKVLNYALALEALEANLYVQALAKLSSLGVSSSDPVVKYLAEFGKVEAQHRDFLTTAINAAGTAPITTTALRGATFNFGNNLADEKSILNFLITVEDTGVKAYLGAITYFSERSRYLPTAAAIQGTEARHTAALIVIRNRKYGQSDPPAPVYTDKNGIDGNLSPNEVLQIVSPLIVLPS